MPGLKRFVVSVIVLALIFTTVQSRALAREEKSTGTATSETMMVDFFVVRPLGLLSTAVGTVVFVGSLPFTVPTGSTGAAFQKLVVDPGKYTFYRPLGEIDERALD